MTQTSDETLAISQTDTAAGPVIFHFQRMSGLDQPMLETDEEWQNLDKLDQKLWMALSCPIQGLEFSAPTLAMLDSDHDGRVRYNEVLDAVAWVCQRLIHPSRLREGSEELPLENIRQDTEEGKNLALAANLALAKCSRENAAGVNLGEVETVLAEASGYPFNGDGIVPPDSAAPDEDMEKVLRMALSIVGGKKDASGKPGLDADLYAEFVKRLEAIRSWREAVRNADLPLGEKTGEAWTLLTRIGPKLDDYFYRCRLAEFAPGAMEKLNEIIFPANSGEEGNVAVPGGFNREMLEAFPIARIDGNKVLAYGEAINPAWADVLEQFQQLLMPIIKKEGGNNKFLDENTWKAIKNRFASYSTTLQSKPQYPLPPADGERVGTDTGPALVLAPAGDALCRFFLPLNANETLGALSDKEIDSLLDAANQRAFDDLAAKDKAAPPLTAIQDLRKAVLFNTHLYTFLMNFLSFLDFYNPEKKAIFQTGVLYLDSRACLLCVPVEDIDQHAALSAQSNLCLIYCACSRKEKDGSERSMNIAAALTNGNLASLVDGRHGVFVDNDGKEWDTRITRIVHNPINLEEAVWAPYIRLGNMATSQIQKFVASKHEAIGNTAAKAVSGVLPGGTPPAPEQKGGGFDFAKGAGIFAALSVALSVLSAAFAYIAHSFVSLGWWWPVAIVVIFLCISGPSVIMAWFKLRRRSISPLLDASGWAVNEGAPINIMMGNSLTTLGVLPPNAKCNLDDPYGLTAILKAQQRRRRLFWQWLLVIVLILAGFACWCYFIGEPAWLLKLRVMWGI